VVNNFRVVAIALAGTLSAIIAVVVLTGEGTSGKNPAVTSLSCGANQLVTLSVGQNDTFNPNADTPAAAPSAGLQARIAPLFPVDDPVVNHRFGHTFAGLPSVVTAAELEVGIKALEDGHGGGNDTLELSFTDAGGTLLPALWSRFIGTSSSNAAPGLLSNLWGPMFWPTGNTFVFDLAALPNPSGQPTNLIAQLNATGYVDYFVQDDSSVDYLVLRLCVRPLAPTQTPTTTPAPLPSVGLTSVPVGTLPAAPTATPTCGPAGTASACTPTPTATPRLTVTPVATGISTRIPPVN
jgi:hypothetical protein